MAIHYLFHLTKTTHINLSEISPSVIGPPVGLLWDSTLNILRKSIVFKYLLKILRWDFVRLKWSLGGTTLNISEIFFN